MIAEQPTHRTVTAKGDGSHSTTPVAHTAVDRRNVVLIGMMGSGKSTIGRQVARRLGRPFVDTDAIIAIEAGCSVTELFEERGEEAFRDLEAAVVGRVAAVPNQIIAVGGGAVLRPGNVAALRATGHVVLLDATAAQLSERVMRGHAREARPLLAGDAANEILARLHAIHEARRHLYEAAATHRVDSGHRPPAVIAAEIVGWVTGADG